LLSEPSNAADVDYRSLKYLIKSFAIGYAYSSSSMLNRDVSSRNVSSPSMLAMGFTDGRTLRDGETQLSQIVGAEEELHALAQRFSSGKFLFGKDAHEANFKRMAPEYDILHLAVHGSGDVEKNFAASLYFGKSDNGEDGELHAYELYGLKLNALMAVLSSCESGLGKGYRGEGMISMASAFTYSGCQNILMSLWKVNDQTAMRLMDDFYGFLLAGETIDVALRNAKLKYLDAADEFSADPRTWTPLVAYGNLNQIFRKDINNVLVYGGIVLISAIAFVFWKIIKSKAARG
jgi:CHAT domain-containing protein